MDCLFASSNPFNAAPRSQSLEERQPYIERAADDKKRYDIEMAEWEVRKQLGLGPMSDLGPQKRKRRKLSKAESLATKAASAFAKAKKQAAAEERRAKRQQPKERFFGGRSKVKKPDGYPKKPTTAFTYYVIEVRRNRQHLLDEQATFAENAKRIGELWKLTPAADKAVFEAQAKEDSLRFALAKAAMYTPCITDLLFFHEKKRYRKELAAFKAKHSDSEKSSDSKGWAGFEEKDAVSDANDVPPPPLQGDTGSFASYVIDDDDQEQTDERDLRHQSLPDHLLSDEAQNISSIEMLRPESHQIYR